MGSQNQRSLNLGGDEQGHATWELVERQHGVVARRQLLALGYSAKGIRHRLASGRLHRLHQGVYAVGRRSVGVNGRWMAAVLACGPKAILSYSSAAALWRIGAEERDLIEISVPSPYQRRRPGLRIYRRPSLWPEDHTSHHGIR